MNKTGSIEADLTEGAMSANSERLYALIEEAAERLRWWQRSGRNQVRTKSDGTPVGSADLESDELLRKGLVQIANIPLVTEESWIGASGELRDASSYWLVDPLDGTRNFIEGHSDYSIIVGLVRNGTPVLGGVAHPARREIFLGERNHGVTHISGTSSAPRAVPPLKPPAAEGMRMAVPRYRSGSGDERTVALASALRIDGSNVLPVGSAMKSTTLLSGGCEIVISFEAVQLWDLGGVAALLQEAGGVVRFPSGAPISFSLSDLCESGSPLVQGYFAGTPGVVDRAAAELVRIEA